MADMSLCVCVCVCVCRFVASEKWRKEFGTNSLITDFEYPEKPEVFEYYPQYYHKTDKVRSPSHRYDSTTGFWDRAVQLINIL